MDTSTYRNRKVEALSPIVGTPFSCLASPDGLPTSTLQPSEPWALPLPVTYVRLVTSPHGDERRLKDFLASELHLREGVDYQQHGNGYRGGRLYFDFADYSVVERLEALADKKGLSDTADRPLVKIPPIPEMRLRIPTRLEKVSERPPSQPKDKGRF